LAACLTPTPGSLALKPIELAAVGGKSRLVLGRSKDCDFRLPTDGGEVSRRHAEFVYQDGRWGIADLGSSWGTIVNGMKISPNRLIQIGDGDLICIHPWTFRADEKSGRGSAPIEEDSGVTMVRTLSGDAAEPLRQDMLNLLLEASSAIQTAEDEGALAAVLTKAARSGTGLANAAVLRVVDGTGNAEPIGAAPQPDNCSRAFCLPGRVSKREARPSRPAPPRSPHVPSPHP
jgi:predicted component of type VI protein secretion system